MERESGKKERSREKIMHAAKGLFEERGIENVTFNDIADKVDMCRTTVFNHFANVNELMLSICKQEIDDIEEYCNNSGLSGKELIMAMFYKLIEDTSYYPALMSSLTSNAILSKDENNPLGLVEDIVTANLEGQEKERKMLLIMGAYYSIVNHYHLREMDFDAVEMKEKFRKIIKEVI